MDIDQAGWVARLIFVGCGCVDDRSFRIDHVLVFNELVLTNGGIGPLTLRLEPFLFADGFTNRPRELSMPANARWRMTVPGLDASLEIVVSGDQMTVLVRGCRVDEIKLVDDRGEEPQEESSDLYVD